MDDATSESDVGVPQHEWDECRAKEGFAGREDVVGVEGRARLVVRGADLEELGF